jgi:transcriptional antiterminator
MDRHNDLSKQVCDFLKSHKLISVNKLEKKLNLPQSTIAQALNSTTRFIPSKHLYSIIFELVQYGLKIDGYEWEIDDNLNVPNIYGRKFVELVDTIEDENSFVYVVKEYRTLASDLSDLI